MMAYVIGCAEVLSLLSVCESEQLPAVCAPTRGVSAHSQLCLCVTGCVWVCVHQLCTSLCVSACGAHGLVTGRYFTLTQLGVQGSSRSWNVLGCLRGLWPS